MTNCHLRKSPLIGNFAIYCCHSFLKKKYFIRLILDLSSIDSPIISLEPFRNISHDNSNRHKFRSPAINIGFVSDTFFFSMEVLWDDIITVRVCGRWQIGSNEPCFLTSPRPSTRFRVNSNAIEWSFPSNTNYHMISHLIRSFATTFKMIILNLQIVCIAICTGAKFFGGVERTKLNQAKPHHYEIANIE